MSHDESSSCDENHRHGRSGAVLRPAEQNQPTDDDRHPRDELIKSRSCHFHLSALF